MAMQNFVKRSGAGGAQGYMGNGGANGLRAQQIQGKQLRPAYNNVSPQNPMQYQNHLRRNPQEANRINPQLKTFSNYNAPVRY